MDLANNKRIIWIDAVKGSGIIFVMLSHLGINTLYIGQYITAAYMQMFFILTGYCIYNNITIKNFVIKRVKRLLVPYFFYGIAINVIILFSAFYKGNFTIQALFNKFLGLLYSRYCFYPLGADGNTYYLSIFAPAWFLTALFVSSILFLPFLYLKAKQIKFLVLIYFAATLFLNKLPILLPWSLDTACIGALFIYVGYRLKNNNINPPRMNIMRLFWWIGALIIYVVLVNYNSGINMSVRVYGNHKASPAIFFVIGVMGSFIYFYLLKFFEKTFTIKLFAKLGNYTVSLLCTHAFIYFCIRKLQGVFEVNDDVYQFIAFFAALCTGILVKMIFEKLEKHIKFAKYL